MLFQKEHARSKQLAHRNNHFDTKRKERGWLEKSVRRCTRDHRRGLVRYEPKKGGGGGKGTWGRPGDERYATTEIDAGDPTYDPALDGPQSSIVLEPYSALTSDSLDAIVRPILDEYFSVGNAEEAASYLYELDLAGLRPQLAAACILASLEKHDEERELISQLLSDIHGTLLTHEELAAAFEIVFDGIEELHKDVPSVDILVGKFIARAIGDDILAPKFTQSRTEPRCAEEASAIALARSLLSTPDGLFRLDSIWGAGGAIRPVNLLVRKMQELIEEFYAENDRAEAERCLADLRVPHFHHEFVYEAILAAMDKPDKRLAAATDLFQHLHSTGALAVSQLVAGLQRVADSIGDLCLDVPRAAALFNSYDAILWKGQRAN